MVEKTSPPRKTAVQSPKRRDTRSGRRLRGPVLGGIGVLAVAALIGGFTLTDRSSKQGPSASAPRSGLAPTFDERDVVTGRPVTSAALRGHGVLLFFSEGVMCQACLEQIKDLEQLGGELRRRNLLLVSITTDEPSALRQAASAYGITTPLLSDEDRDMSRAYDVLGRGMHPDTAGHTFVLVDGRGRIRWRRDYTTMYVPPKDLLAAVPPVGSA